MKGRIQKSWDIGIGAQLTEDWPMEVTIQENANAAPTGTLVFGRGEISAQHLHRQLREDIDGEAYRSSEVTIGP